MWHEITSDPWKDLENVDIAFLPVGSFEQHGPLPLYTDTLIAFSVARELARGGGVLLPPIFYGLSKEHRDFPLTIYVEIETFMGYIKDILRSLQAHGVRATVIVNGHGGNQDALRTLIGYWNYEQRMKALLIWPFSCIEVRDEWHAGFAEASIVSFLLGRDYEGEGRLCEYIYPYFRTRECSETGSLYGGRFRSDREVGKKLFEEMVRCSRRRVEDFISHLFGGHE